MKKEMNLERIAGVGPAFPAWKAGVLPLHHTRRTGGSFSARMFLGVLIPPH